MGARGIMMDLVGVCYRPQKTDSLPCLTIGISVLDRDQILSRRAARSSTAGVAGSSMPPSPAGAGRGRHVSVRGAMAALTSSIPTRLRVCSGFLRGPRRRPDSASFYCLTCRRVRESCRRQPQSAAHRHGLRPMRQVDHWHWHRLGFRVELLLMLLLSIVRCSAQSEPARLATL